MQRQDRPVIDQRCRRPASSFGSGNEADQEIALDLQILAGLLPKARIVVYFAPNTISKPGRCDPSGGLR